MVQQIALLSAGAVVVNRVDSDGNNAFFAASQRDYVEVVKLLRECGANDIARAQAAAKYRGHTVCSTGLRNKGTYAKCNNKLLNKQYFHEF